MRTRPWIRVGLPAAAIALMAFGFLPQRATLNQLREKLDQARNAPPPVASPPAAPAAVPTRDRPPGPDRPRLGLTQEEKLEQARLRAELTRLRERQRTLAGAARENQRLRAELNRAGTNAASGTVPVPSGYIRRSAAQMRGFDTPERTLESFLWAIERRDTNSLLAALAPETAARISGQLEREGVEGFWEELTRIPGYKVNRAEPAGEDETTLWLEFAPGIEAQSMKFQQTNGRWWLMD